MIGSCIKIATLILGGLIVLSCAILPTARSVSLLEGKVICLDPGHGGTAAFDQYRVGPSGEREEWIDLRVALILNDLLEAKGARVLMTRTEDVQVPLKDRALLAVDNKADVFISLHHNATADPQVNFPIIYYHGNASENLASVQLGKCLARRMNEALFGGTKPVSLVSDHTIFPTAGTAVLRHSYGIPGVICEASFFSNPEEEQRLKDKKYNRKEAEAYVKALEDYFCLPSLPIKEKYSAGKLTPFPVLQEAERMNETAKRWHQDFVEARELMKNETQESLEKAYELFTRSAKSFPDSWVARDCHICRATILQKMRKKEEAAEEHRRAEEYYVPINVKSIGRN
jgi:N-acetylmuramoyl-L-alanine amidase